MTYGLAKMFFWKKHVDFDDFKRITFLIGEWERNSNHFSITFFRFGLSSNNTKKSYLE